MSFSSREHIEVGRVSALAASPCGTWLAVEVRRLDRDASKYIGDLWKVPTDGSDALQLTHGEQDDAQPCFRSDGALGFLSNRASERGDARDRKQVWILPAEGGEPRQITDEPSGVQAFRFAREADRLIVLSSVLLDLPFDEQRARQDEQEEKGPSGRRFRGQPVRHWDHWLHDNEDLPRAHLIAFDAEGAGRVDLTPAFRAELDVNPRFDVSPDGRGVVATCNRVGADRSLDVALVRIDVESLEHELLGAEPYVELEAPCFAPDSRGIAAIRSARSKTQAGRPTLVFFDDSSVEARELCPGWDRQPSLHGFSSDGRWLLVAADDEGSAPIFRVSTDDGRVVRSSPAAGGSHTALIGLADGSIAGIRSSFCSAPEPFALDEQGAERPTATLSGLEPFGDVSVETLRTPSTDGVDIQTWLLKPRNAAGPLPTLVWIHGGPISSTLDAWHWRWNPMLLVSQGYAVALPNPRGSTGFGHDFIQGIWGNEWGGQCYEDLMAVCDALAERPDVDAKRMMAMGGSFGGYMTNWIGTQTDRFRCLITHASIVDMSRFASVTDHPAWWHSMMGGTSPYGERERFDRYSPMRHISNWKTPTLIIHGERDFRCPVGESLALFEALQHHGVDSELLIFPKENHWIVKPANIVQWYEAVSEFVGRHLR